MAYLNKKRNQAGQRRQEAISFEVEVGQLLAGLKLRNENVEYSFMIEKPRQTYPEMNRNIARAQRCKKLNGANSQPDYLLLEEHDQRTQRRRLRGENVKNLGIIIDAKCYRSELTLEPIWKAIYDA